MYEKVNPAHPDKIADRIAGAIVDLAYSKESNPKIAVEVLIGHGNATVVIESNITFMYNDIDAIIKRIAGEDIKLYLQQVPQDTHLANNQSVTMRCGDNGIFKGMPITVEQSKLTEIAYDIYGQYGTDGKYIYNQDEGQLIICQSHADKWLYNEYGYDKHIDVVINPLGEWTGGINVDSGATNRKLGSDMGDAVTGGGLCLSGDTEYLGEDLCWHSIDGYKSGKIAQWNNGELEFVTPIKYIHNKNDDFIHIYNSTKLDMMLTPYHQMLIKTSKNNFVKRPAYLIAEKLNKGVGNSGEIPHYFRYNPSTNPSSYQDENDYRLQIAFCADGTVLNDSNKKWNGRIRVKKEHKKNRLRLLLQGKEYKETSDGEYSNFWYRFPTTSKSLRECCQNEDWSILKDEIFRWDGDADRKLFRTTIKDDADFIQLIVGSFGDVATITKSNDIGRKHIVNGKEYVRKTNYYTVHLLKSTCTHLRKSKKSLINVEYIKEKADSYCFEVPSHNLIVRRNNKIFITGNCGKDLSKADVSINIYAHLKAQMTGKPVELYCAIGDDYVDGKPYSEIVDIAKEYIDSIGGFEKLAEWGLIR